ncbi:hypothetical protein HDK64DRAFT_256003 [Phyllosticta capitalensis]
MSNSHGHVTSESNCSSDNPLIPTPRSDTSEPRKEAQLRGKFRDCFLSEGHPDDVRREPAPIAHDARKSQKETRRLTKEVDCLKAEVEMMMSEWDSALHTVYLARTVGFWDPGCLVFSSGSPVGYTKKQDGMHYFQVEQFVEAVQAATNIIPAWVIRTSLPVCFLGAARTWFTSILTDDQRHEAKEGDGVEN